MDHSPDRRSLVVKLKVKQSSLLVHYQLNERAASHRMKLRRRNSDITTAPGAEVASDIDNADRQVTKLKVPTISHALTPPATPATNSNIMMAQTQPPVLDPKLYGRERSTRKRTITPSTTGTMRQDPPAKKRKLNSKADSPQAADVPESASSLSPLQSPAEPTENESTVVTKAPVKLRSFRTGRPLAIAHGFDMQATMTRDSGDPMPPSERRTPPQMPQRADSPITPVFLIPTASHVDLFGNARPLRDPGWDQKYVNFMLEELNQVIE